MLKSEICILGAGPAGVAVALKLSHLGVPCTIIDKAVFPRDKVCGDAIGASFSLLLNRLDPEILKRFKAKSFQLPTWGIRLFTYNNIKLDLPTHSSGFVVKRKDFDNFLIEEIKRRDNITFYEGRDIVDTKKIKNGFILTDKTGDFAVQTKLLIIANGAYSSFTRHYVGYKKEPKHYCGAVRAYFENVCDFNDDNFIEIHFFDAIYPGYFWIFPLSGNRANVGLGMRSDFISKNKVNLKKKLEHILENHPVLKERFKNAKQLDKIKGYGLPLGSKKRKLSGHNYILVGDAGHLIDPLSGEGIGNAFYSGFIAAEQAQKCLETNDYSEVFLQSYDERIEKVLGKELKLSYYLQRSLRFVWLWKTFLFFIKGKEQKLANVLAYALKNEKERRKLKNPFFWFRLIFSKVASPNK